MRKFIDDIDSGKINNKESAVDSYLKNIYPDKKFLETKNIVKEKVIKKGKNKGKTEETNSYKLKKYLMILNMHCMVFWDQHQKVRNLILQQVYKKLEIHHY